MSQSDERQARTEGPYEPRDPALGVDPDPAPRDRSRLGRERDGRARPDRGRLLRPLQEQGRARRQGARKRDRRAMARADRAPRGQAARAKVRRDRRRLPVRGAPRQLDDGCAIPAILSELPDQDSKRAQGLPGIARAQPADAARRDAARRTGSASRRSRSWSARSRIARATRGSELSDRILAAGRKAARSIAKVDP